MHADHYVRSTSTLENRNILALTSVLDATRRVADIHEPTGSHHIEQPTVREGDGVAVRHTSASATGIVDQPLVRPGLDAAVLRSATSAPGRGRCENLTDEFGTTRAKPYRCLGSGRFANNPSPSDVRPHGDGMLAIDADAGIEKSRLAAAVAVRSIRQIRNFARDASAAEPESLHEVTSTGAVRALNIPQSVGSGLLRRRIKRVRQCTSSDDESPQMKKRNRSDQRLRACRAAPIFTYPDADEMFLDVERELGLGKQEPFYPATGWCRPPADHPDFADWITKHPEDADLSQQERLVKENSSRAAEFRKALQESAPTVVCCVCSCFVCPSESQRMLLTDVPGLQLLRKDTSATDQVPRSGHTSVQYDGIDYLLQPDAVFEGSGATSVTICSPCHRVLKSGKIPKASLAAIDPGLIPATLPKLSIMEALIISPSRLHCHVLTLTPGRRHESHPERTEDSEGHKVDWTTASTGHTVAFRNPGPDAFVQTFPIHPDAIPSLFKVRVYSSSLI